MTHVSNTELVLDFVIVPRLRPSCVAIPSTTVEDYDARMERRVAENARGGRPGGRG